MEHLLEMMRRKFNQDQSKDGEMDMTDKSINDMIEAAGLTAPRITPDHLESIITNEHSFTLSAALSAMGYPVLPECDVFTMYVLVLKNGFVVTGESACVSPKNFNAAIGRAVARKNAVDKIWALEGYLLKSNLAGLVSC